MGVINRVMWWEVTGDGPVCIIDDLYVDTRDNVLVQYWQGKELPKLPVKATAEIQVVGDAVVVEIRTSGGSITLAEPLDEFPSDKLIAQIMLIV